VSVGADDVAPLSQLQPEKLSGSEGSAKHPCQSVFPSEPRTTMCKSLPSKAAAGLSHVAPGKTVHSPQEPPEAL